MTVAVCLKCGAMKHGAWKSCPECRYTPETAEDQAKALMASDHVLGKADLEAVSDRIKQGGTVSFQEDQVQKMAQSIAQQGPELKREAGRFVMGCALAAVILLVIGIVLMVWRNSPSL